MPNFELIFKKVVRVWRGDEIVKDLGTFRRVIVVPDLDLAKQIAGAMEGEQLHDVPGFELMSGVLQDYSDKIKFNDTYEIGLGDAISVIETNKEPMMGELSYPIPNYQFIWNRVRDKLNWYWFNGIVVEFSITEKTHRIEEMTKIDGVIVKNFSHPLSQKHQLGIIGIHKGKFNSYEEAQNFLKSLLAAK